MDVEGALIAYLSSVLDVPVYADVPEDRPDVLITVERTGGGLDTVVRDSATIAVQCWHTTRSGAAALAYSVRSVLPAFAKQPGICKSTIDGLYTWPTEHGEPRYQIVLDVVARADAS